MCCLLSKYHSDVIFGLWSMDIDWQVPSLCTDSSLRRHQQVQNHSNTRSSRAITLKIKPTTMSWSRCCFKKKSRKLCITNKYKYKIHNKIYPIQHSARSGKRCIEVTNRDEYKNITTRNVGVFSLSIMDIATYTMTPGADPGFQVRGGGGGGALKKIAPSGGRRENFGGISCEKSRFYAKKLYFFQLQREARKILGYIVWKITIIHQQIIFFPILGGARAGCAPPPSPLDPPLDITNQLPRSDFCVHRDFPRITIGVRDGRADMA